MSAAAEPLLLLWDIDGTLLQHASAAHAAALHLALREVHGEDLELEGTSVQAAGRTDGSIARELLVACGVEGERVDGCIAAVQDACARHYRRLCPPDLTDRLAPGIAELLPGLAADPRYRLSLVTGNFEPVARIKLAAAGLGRYFEPGQGGFGSDAEAREALPPVARSRAGDGAGPWPRERTVVIGDTPNDIACARADAVRVVAVTTGPFGAAELTGADHVAAGAAEVGALLGALAG